MTLAQRMKSKRADVRYQAKHEKAMWEALRREIGQPSSLANHSRLDAGKKDHQHEAWP